jgi:diguanylate cyclase (GGDEF)-like protein
MRRFRNVARELSVRGALGDVYGRAGRAAAMNSLVENRRFAAISIALVLVALIGSALPPVVLPRLALTAPISYFIVVLGDAATALVVFALRRTAVHRRAKVVLAFSLFMNAAIMLACFLVLPLLFGPPVVSSPQQFPAWLFTFWHVGVAIGAYAYLLARDRERAFAWGTRVTLIVSGTIAALVCAAIAAGYRFGDRLPVLASAAGTGGLVHIFVGPAVLVLLAGAAVWAYRIRAPSAIERGFALSLLTVALSFGLFLLVTHRFTPTYYLGRVLIATSSLLVLFVAVQALIASRTRLDEVEGKLGFVETESAKRAARGRAIWEICLLPPASELDRFNAILLIATKALRPGLPMAGILAHREGDSVVIDATEATELDRSHEERFSRIAYPGAVHPLEGTLANRLLATGRARAWNESSSDAEFPLQRVGLRSFIGVPMDIAGEMYFLEFASTIEMTDDPFGDDDLAYVDVIASLLAFRFRQQQQFERIKFEMEHDALTGLENRAQFRGTLRAAIALGRPFALAIINLDGFRHLNERHGHQIGDELLVEVATKLNGAAYPNVAARVSADEFAVLIAGVDSRQDTVTALKRYSDVFVAPFPAGGRTGEELVAVGASIGAARFPSDGVAVEELMRRAEVSLDVAKSGGGSTTVLFEQSMQALLDATRLRYIELQEAIASDQLAVAYQPTFALASRKVIGAEALVRWNHPQKGMILPGEFIDFAQRNGLIRPLSTWVFKRVCQDILSVELPPGFRIYFNLAAQMLDDIPFITALSEAVLASPRLGANLGIEVTESAAMQNVERSMNTIALFRGWGIHVAIDDFGTGHSSLAYLKQLTVDLVKIDQSFVAGLPTEERDAELLDMLLRIIERFGFAVLAEGIETEDQLAWLLAHGCTRGQGYLLAKPHPFSELLERIGFPTLRPIAYAEAIAVERRARAR